MCLTDYASLSLIQMQIYLPPKLLWSNNNKKLYGKEEIISIIFGIRVAYRDY